MRSIGKIDNEPEARRFSDYLRRKGVENTTDVAFDSVQGHFSYSIWVHNEDQLVEAAHLFERFQANPRDPEFDITIAEQMRGDIEISDISPDDVAIVEQVKKRPRATLFLIALCAFVFLLNWMQAASLQKEGLKESLITPVQITLLYDVPPVLEEYEAMIEKYKGTSEQIPPEMKTELETVEKTPFWRGIYDWTLLKLKGENSDLAEGSLFSKLRQGEIWRLFSPCILHADLLHILFNMLWLWVLGRQIEERVGLFRYILLTLLVGIGSNAVQYLMSGPFFLGYSGVVMGLTGFIWAREKIAPWEGYPLQKSMILFLVLFVLAMFGLQLGSFLLLLFTSVNFSPNIANSAHIAGAIIGAILGRLSFFSARPT